MEFDLRPSGKQRKSMPPPTLVATCLLALALSTIGCGGMLTPESTTGGVTLVGADTPRAAAQAPPEDVRQLVADNTAFAVDLLRALTSSGAPAAEDNVVISPYSISIALAMTYAGAKGETADEMARALHFSLPSDRLHAAFNSLDQTLAKRSREIPPSGEGDKTSRVEFTVVNQLWAQQGYAFLAEFLERLAADYGAGLRTVDFVKDAEAARLAINAWVAQVTKDRIKDLLPGGSVNDLTRLVLTNAVYLKAPWLTPFDEAATQDGEFHLGDGSTVTVPFMHQTELLGFAESERWQVVELPYKGGELAMVIMLPRGEGAEGDLAASVGDLSGTELARLLGDGPLQSQNLSLALPKFTTSSELSLEDALRTLGMTISFTDNADFSGMTGEKDLAIGGVFHNGFVAVDEAGTEAAAATAVVMRATAAPAEPRSVTVDRPFLWLIRDVETGTILFLGQVLDPRAE